MKSIPVLLVGALCVGCSQTDPLLKEYRNLAAKQPGLLAEAKKQGVPVGIEALRSRRPVNPENNAAAGYRTIEFNKIEVPTDSKITSVVKYEATKRDAKGAEKQLKSYVKWMQKADAATDKPDCDFDRKWSDGLYVKFPEYGVLRRLAKLYCARIYLDARSKDYAGLVDDVKRTYRLAHHAENDPGLISFLVETAIWRMVNTEIRIILEEFELDPALLKALGQGIDSRDQGTDFSRHMIEEYVLIRYVVQNQLTPPRNIEEAQKTLKELSRSGSSNKAKDSLYRAVGQPAKLCMQAHDARMLEFLISSHRSFKTKNQTDAVLEITRNAHSMVADKRPGSFLSEYFNLAFLADTYGAHQQTLSELAVTRAALKVLCARYASGQYPAQVTDIDPFDGKPLDYQRTPDGFNVASRCRQVSYGDVLLPKTALTTRRKRLLRFEYKNRP